MTNFRRTCPVCGSDSVAHANASFQLSIDRRCKTCGSVWRLPWGAVESIVGLVLGAGLALGAGWFLLIALGKLVAGAFGADDLVFAGFLGALACAGVGAIAKGVGSLRAPRGTVRILKRGEVPPTSDPNEARP